MHLSVIQLQKILLPESQAVTSKVAAVTRGFVVLYLMELVDARICTIDNIDEPLSRNNHQGSILPW